MKKKLVIKIILILSFVGLFVGCSTIGTQATRIPIKNSRTYDESFDNVWNAVILFVGEKNLSISTMEKVSGIIVISNISYEGGWAIEGELGSSAGVKHKVTDRKGNFNIIVREINDKTLVQINSDLKIQERTGNGSQIFPYSYQWKQTYSNGVIERIILDGIEQRIK